MTALHFLCNSCYDGIKQKTKVDSSGGKTTNLSETFTFEVTSCTIPTSWN